MSAPALVGGPINDAVQHACAIEAPRVQPEPATVSLLPVVAAEPVRHSWYPSSPCGSGCLDSPTARAGRVLIIVRVIRLLLVAAVTIVMGLIVIPLPRIVRRAFLQRASSEMLHAIGIRILVEDHRPFGSRARGLIVANHVSYLDILAIAVVHPARFVAKSDVTAIPVVSTLARRLGVIFIDRGSLRTLPAVLDTARAGLEEDSSVAVFPEGTTWCGRAGGGFRPAFFQSALDAGVPILPIGVRFAIDGTITAAPGFFGEDTPVDTLRRVLALREVVVHVRLHEPQMPHGDRRSLAARCEALIHGTDCR